jgi:hypothetical protein
MLPVTTTGRGRIPDIDDAINLQLDARFAVSGLGRHAEPERGASCRSTRFTVCPDR